MIAQMMMGATLLVTAATASAQYQDDRYAAPPPPSYTQGFAAGYAAAPADGEPVASVEVFYEPLSRYGNWVETRWGRAWSPRVPAGWRPYTIGRWEDTQDYGRTWRSDEPFGWATYHYGRWGFDNSYGWVWVPDTVWGPGWVAWREGGDYAGWAPLPPQVDISYGVAGGYGYAGGDYAGGDYAGAGVALGYDQWYEPSWVYVPRSYGYGRPVFNVILPIGRNREWWERTRDVTHYERDGGRIVNRSFEDRRWDGHRDGPGRPDDRRGVAPRGVVSVPVTDNRAAHWGDDARGNDGRGNDGRGGWRGNERGGEQAFAGRSGSALPPAVTNAGAWSPPGAGRGDTGGRPPWERRRSEVFQPATIDNAPPPANAVVRPRQNADPAAAFGRPQRGYAPPPVTASPSASQPVPVLRAPTFAVPAAVVHAPPPPPPPAARPAPPPPPRTAPVQRNEPHPER